MNDQCANCKIRKFCSLGEPDEDWTCESYKCADDYVDFLDENRPEDEKRELFGYSG